MQAVEDAARAIAEQVLAVRSRPDRFWRRLRRRAAVAAAKGSSFRISQARPWASPQAAVLAPSPCPPRAAINRASADQGEEVGSVTATVRAAACRARARERRSRASATAPTPARGGISPYPGPGGAGNGTGGQPPVPNV